MRERGKKGESGGYKIIKKKEEIRVRFGLERERERVRDECIE